MLCASGDRGCCGERPKWREARAEARAEASVVGREALRECVRPQDEASRVLLVRGDSWLSVFWRESEVEARAGGSVVGREALREFIRQRREASRSVVCQRRKRVVCERLKLRHVPRHVPWVH